MSATQQSILSAPDNAQSRTSIMRAKKNMTAVFITEKKEPLTTEEIIAENFDILNRYIDSLDPKIRKIVEHNEAEVLLAYRNHFGRIREQIVKFKEETLAQVKNEANTLIRMEKLEKQIVVFRQQALRLYDNVAEKDKTIEELQIQLSELISQRNHLNKQVKELMRSNKQLKVKQFHEESVYKPQSQINQRIKTEQFQRTFYNLGVSSYKKSVIRDKKIKQRAFTLSNCEHQKALYDSDQVEQFTKNVIPVQKANLFTKKQDVISKTFKQKFGHLQASLLDQIIKETEDIVHKMDKQNKQKEMVGFAKSNLPSDMRKTKYSLYSKPSHQKFSTDKRRSFSRSTVHKESIKTTVSIQDGELRNFFEKCVQTVKKEIAMRKNRVNLNFFNNGHSISLDQFKKIDFYRLLQLTFQNKKLCSILEANLVGSRQDPLKY